MGEILQMLVLENNFPSLKKKKKTYFLVHDHFHTNLSTFIQFANAAKVISQTLGNEHKDFSSVPRGTMEIQKLCFLNKIH